MCEPWNDSWIRALVAVKCWQYDTRRKCGYGKRPDCWIFGFENVRIKGGKYVFQERF